MERKTDEQKKIIEKIHGLFSLAENNPCEKEAQSALELARRLLIKYNLREDEIDTVKNINDSDGGSNTVELKTSRVHNWMKRLFAIVSNYFDVKVFSLQGDIRYKIKTKYIFYGVKINAESAAYAFESLFNQIQKLAKKYKPSRNDFEKQSYYSDYSIFSVQARIEYREGLIFGFYSKIRKIKDKEEKEFGKNKITSLAIRYDKVADDWLEDNNIQLITKKSKCSMSHGTNTDAAIHGYEDSNNLHIGKGLN